MKHKYFKQPSETFGIYDINTPSVSPDISTAFYKAVVSFENQVRGSCIEYGAFFDVGGKQIFDAKGDTNSIIFSFDSIQIKLLHHSIFTHNHPNGSTFSFEDIAIACEMKLTEIRVITKHLRYRMIFNGQWQNHEVLRKAIDETISKANDIVTIMLKTDELNIRHANEEINHQIWRLIAQHFGFTYIRERS